LVHKIASLGPKSSGRTTSTRITQNPDSSE